MVEPNQLQFDGLKLALEENKKAMHEQNRIQEKRNEIEESKFKQIQLQNKIILICFFAALIVVIGLVLGAIWFWNWAETHHLVYYLGGGGR